MAFRDSFKLATKSAIRWFPGHMGKGIRQMQQKLKSVDCIIEVHDSRIPLTGRNPEFRHTIGGIKPHILVLNKKDLGCKDKSVYTTVAEKIKASEKINHVLYTNCKDQQCPGIRKLMPLARDLIIDSDRYNRSNEKDFCVMIIGVPNVGKSSLLNVLRNRHLNKKKASQVGGVAGITRSVLTKIKISEDPLIYMIDTPGILEPKITDDEMGMKLALVGCIPDHLVGEDLIADFLLYYLNKNEMFGYVEFLGLEKPTDQIAEVLVSGAKLLNKTKTIRNITSGGNIVLPDVLSTAQYFIKHFRSGGFGPINLDKAMF